MKSKMSTSFSSKTIGAGKTLSIVIDNVTLIILTSLLTCCGLSDKINNKVKKMEGHQVTVQKEREGLVISRDFTFNDFQGKVPDAPSQKHMLGEIFTTLNYYYHSPILQDSKVYYQFNVNVSFSPSRSWIRLPNDTLVLRHEEIHYKIYQVAAKELKQKLSSQAYQKDLYIEQMKEIYKDLLAKYEVVHAQFDIGSQRDASNNEVWTAKVKQAMSKGKFEIE